MAKIKGLAYNEQVVPELDSLFLTTKELSKAFTKARLTIPSLGNFANGLSNCFWVAGERLSDSFPTLSQTLTNAHTVSSKISTLGEDLENVIFDDVSAPLDSLLELEMKTVKRRIEKFQKAKSVGVASELFNLVEQSHVISEVYMMESVCRYMSSLEDTFAEGLAAIRSVTESLPQYRAYGRERLAKLRSLKETVRNLADKPMKYFGVPLSKLIALEQSSVPAIVTKSLSFLRKRQALREVGIFRISGVKEHIDEARVALDTDRLTEFSPDASVHTVTGLLKMWLRSLPMPLFSKPERFFDLNKVADTELRIKSTSELLRDLPAPNYRVLKLLMGYLHEVSMEASSNMMNAQNLAVVLAPNLTEYKGVQLSNAETFELLAKQEAMVTFVIQHYDDLFAPMPSPKRAGSAAALVTSNTTVAIPMSKSLRKSSSTGGGDRRSSPREQRLRTPSRSKARRSSPRSSPTSSPTSSTKFLSSSGDLTEHARSHSDSRSRMSIGVSHASPHGSPISLSGGGPGGYRRKQPFPNNSDSGTSLSSSPSPSPSSMSKLPSDLHLSIDAGGAAVSAAAASLSTKSNSPREVFARKPSTTQHNLNLRLKNSSSGNSIPRTPAADPPPSERLLLPPLSIDSLKGSNPAVAALISPRNPRRSSLSVSGSRKRSPRGSSDGSSGKPRQRASSRAVLESRK